MLSTASCTIPESTPISRHSFAEEGVYAANLNARAGLAIISQVSGDIKVFNTETLQEIYSWRHQGEGINLVDIVKISDDGTFAVTAENEAFAVWNLETGEPIGYWRIDQSSIRDIAISNGGSSILIGKADGSVMFFEPFTERRIEFIAH